MPQTTRTSPIAEATLDRLRTDLADLDTVLARLRQGGYPQALVAAECQAAGTEGTAARAYARAGAANYQITVDRIAEGATRLERAISATGRLVDCAQDAAHR